MRTGRREGGKTRDGEGSPGQPPGVSRKGVAPPCTTTVLTEGSLREGEVERARGKEPWGASVYLRGQRRQAARVTVVLLKTR